MELEYVSLPLEYAFGYVLGRGRVTLLCDGDFPSILDTKRGNQSNAQLCLGEGAVGVELQGQTTIMSEHLYSCEPWRGGTNVGEVPLDRSAADRRYRQCFYCSRNDGLLPGVDVCEDCGNRRTLWYGEGAGRYVSDHPATICFYDRTAPFYELTNFFPCDVMVDGKVYRSAEHCYQALKFSSSPQIAEMVQRAVTAREAFEVSHMYARIEDPMTDDKRLENMTVILRAKFQNSYLRGVLLLTGRSRLVECSPYDRFWGEGADGGGRNHLGNILERLRSEVDAR